ncbi:MAG: hypothetical protein A4E61_00333 [Syntrophorhabdus sp. PtaB.Bin184]|nr:MAG: hypothetical protein A4E61_00333 [Syntrophorhabdus sp. PtaB.Bin184]
MIFGRARHDVEHPVDLAEHVPANPALYQVYEEPFRTFLPHRLHHLVVDALGRDVPQLRVHGTDEVHGLRGDREPLAGEPEGTEHPQGILRESFRYVPDDPVFQVLAAVERIDELPGGEPARHCVDGEVPPAKVLPDLGHGTGPGSFSPWQGDLYLPELLAVHREHRYRRFRVHVGEPEIEKPLRRQDRQQIDILRISPGKEVPDAPSHQEDLVQILLQDPRERLYPGGH